MEEVLMDQPKINDNADYDRYCKAFKVDYLMWEPHALECFKRLRRIQEAIEEYND